MEYGKLFSRSLNIVWQNKFLILLGFIAALGSGSLGNGGGSSGGGGGNGNGGQLTQTEQEVLGWVIGAVIAVICVAILIGIALWAASAIARGGLIASVDAIESGQKSSFSAAWRAGWNRAATLLGIGILPGIPALILLIIGIISFGVFGGLFAFFSEDFDSLAGIAGLGTVLAVVGCFMAPLILILAVLRNFAERACMLEGLGVVDSYRRGFNVLKDNLGEAIILFLAQMALFIVLGVLLFVPGVIAAVCCFLWPVLMIFSGASEAYVSSLWTLAWREWTGLAPRAKMAPEAM